MSAINARYLSVNAACFAAWRGTQLGYKTAPASPQVETATDSAQRSERLASERSAKDYPINFSRCCE